MSQSPAPGDHHKTGAHPSLKGRHLGKTGACAARPRSRPGTFARQIAWFVCVCSAAHGVMTVHQIAQASGGGPEVMKNGEWRMENGTHAACPFRPAAHAGSPSLDRWHGSVGMHHYPLSTVHSSLEKGVADTPNVMKNSFHLVGCTPGTDLCRYAVPADGPASPGLHPASA
jgi:hypothetical protein